MNWFLTSLLLLAASTAAAQSRTAELRLSFGANRGPLNIDRFALGQGGLSEQPMWDQREAEIRALHPRVIRLFVQEYFDLLPASGQYNFGKLDQSVDLILRTGATPLMSLAFKPAVLFPVVNQDIVEPKDYGAWEQLISTLVRHYKERGSGIRYWEVGNEPDIGESGGCPFRFKPDSYARFYEHTAKAILESDPQARVGGPALANWKSPILPALLETCDTRKIPLHFVSWHIYNSDPRAIRGTIDSVRALLGKFPSLKPETILDEWNMSFGPPAQGPRFQPCYVAETAWQMKEGGLDYSCYYHIRDYHVDRDRFARFMSLRGASFMARWWNRMPQYHGLFDYQNTIRPAYFAFKLISRLTGDRLDAQSNDASVHAFLTYDKSYDLYNLLVWNFSPSPADISIQSENLPRKLTAKRRRLDATSPGDDENVRLRQMPDLVLNPGSSLKLPLEPFGMEFWSLEPGS